MWRTSDLTRELFSHIRETKSIRRQLAEMVDGDVRQYCDQLSQRIIAKHGRSYEAASRDVQTVSDRLDFFLDSVLDAKQVIVNLVGVGKDWELCDVVEKDKHSIYSRGRWRGIY